MAGYVNVDFPQSRHSVATVKADIYADLLEIKLEPCDEIRSHHVFEHFNYMESLLLLVKWVRALEIGGTLIVDVPDVEFLCSELSKSIASNNIDRIFKIIRLLYGSHEADWAFHINGWTSQTLSGILERMGCLLSGGCHYGDINSPFPNLGLRMDFRKNSDICGIEDVARDALKAYAVLPAEEALVREFHKQFDAMIGKGWA